VTQINEYHIKQFAWLLDKMKAIPDGDVPCWIIR